MRKRFTTNFRILTLVLLIVALGVDTSVSTVSGQSPKGHMHKLDSGARRLLPVEHGGFANKRLALKNGPQRLVRSKESRATH